MINNYLIREEKESDFDKISELHIASFHHDTEAILVKELRKIEGYRPSFSQVVVVDDLVVGHGQITLVNIENPTSTYRSAVIGPISISKDFQGQGLGTKLVEKLLDTIKEMGIETALVYGGDYYYRFGFKKAKYVYRPNPVKGHGILIKYFKKTIFKRVSGVIHYPTPFSPLINEWKQQ